MKEEVNRVPARSTFLKYEKNIAPVGRGEGVLRKLRMTGLVSGCSVGAKCR